MSKRLLWNGLMVGCLVAALAPAFAQAQTCEPLNNGRLANVFHEGTALFFEPVVEFRKMTLTIGGPCEDIVKVFSPKEQIAFDLREIERLTDGQYTWQLQREASVDPSVQQELQASRGSGKEDALWWNYFQKGLIPEGPYMDSGSFAVVRGQIIDPNSSGEEKSATLGEKASRGGSSSAIQSALAGGLSSSDSGGESNGNVLATKDTVLTNSDGTIRNSLCVGFDCLNDNTYSDTTILLTENNTRIKFDDTSSVNSFPRNDWEIEANSNLNGGANYLGFNDCGQSSGGGCASDLVFAVEAGVRQHALYVESDGDIGVGTANPVVRMHLVDGDTPALRLEQDGSSGFQPQVWDLAGNETSFFIRDATNGSTLPFRVFPGMPSGSLVLRNDNVGIGTTSPNTDLHILATGEAPTDVQFKIETNTDPAFDFAEQDSGVTWRFINNNTALKIVDIGSGADPAEEFVLTQAGDLTITGEIFTNGSCSLGCDRVFAPDYDLESIEEHAALMWTKSYLPAVGPTPEQGTINLSQKTTGILNELEKAHIYIEQLHKRLAEQERRKTELAERMTAVESLLVNGIAEE